MDKQGVAALAAASAGGLIALQAPINGTLGRVVGSLPAAAISFAVGTTALVALAFVLGGGFGRVGEATGGLSWVYFTGGLLGAIYVTTALVTVRALGAGGVTAATIAGQLTMALVIDRMGVLGLAERPLSVQRLVAVALLGAGTYLMVSGD